MKKTPSSGLTIRCNALAKRFNREWIFRKLDVEFAAGKTYAITGANGSGKSTLLQVLWGQLPPSGGSITYHIDEQEVLAEDVFRYVSIAAPYMDLIEEFTLAEHIDFHTKMKPLREGITTADLAKRMYLEKALNKQIGNFSSGMKQRVKLGLALATEASVVFLDEPGTNLDRAAFEWYLDQLKQLPDQCTVIIASNNPEEYLTADQTLNIMDFK